MSQIKVLYLLLLVVHVEEEYFLVIAAVRLRALLCNYWVVLPLCINNKQLTTNETNWVRILLYSGIKKLSNISIMLLKPVMDIKLKKEIGDKN